MFEDKTKLLEEYRSKVSIVIEQIMRNNKSKNDRAKAVNGETKNVKDALTTALLRKSNAEKWGKERILNAILLVSYTANVVMLESRNEVWEYEYMAFARRIGELWEPFCKVAFEFPIKNLILIQPKRFADVQGRLQASTKEYIEKLEVDTRTKQQLEFFYRIPWNMVDSGNIKLDLDLHFNQDGINYNCDFKSGFSSNEKGNTNRLLLVASIYKQLAKNEQTILFVRQNEDDNNHYLQTLKNSGNWEVYCADEAYEKINEFTGFDYREWLNGNATWLDDFKPEFRKHLKDNDLSKYLTW